MKSLAIIVVFLGSIGGLLANKSSTGYPVAGVYTAMRDRILKMTPKESPFLKGKPIYAVLMEMKRPEVAITLMTIADGGASLYFSNGGGIIGLGEHANVRKASLDFIESSSSFVSKMKKVSDYPLPQSDQVQFYVITPEGVYRASARESDVGQSSHQLHALWTKSQDVISQMSKTQSQKQAGLPAR